MDEDEVLDTSIAGATLTAKVRIDTGTGYGAWADVDVTNNDDGTFDIDWPVGVDDSAFTSGGIMEVVVKVVNGDYAYALNPFTMEIRDAESVLD